MISFLVHREIRNKRTWLHVWYCAYRNATQKLTAGEQKIAQLVLEREDDILIHSATEIAEMAGVSKATTARFFQHLGYADFNEVKLQAREERNRTEPFEYSSTVDEEVPLVRTISAHLDLEIANITRTFEGLRSDKMREAAELIAEAPRVWVIGLGDEEGFARYARLLFSRLRHSVMLRASTGGHGLRTSP